MSLLQIVLIAFGVAADAFAVSLARGTKIREDLPRRALVLALAFGLAQAIMPLIGWLVGNSVLGFITDIDHWIAFALLGGVGLHMVVESLPSLSARRAERGEDVADLPVGTETGADAAAAGDHSATDSFGIRSVLVLALATSIDALAVGFGFAATDLNVGLAVSVIGVTTFVLSLLGVWLGHRSGQRFGKPATAIGGLVLIGIGTSILVEHLSQS